MFLAPPQTTSLFHHRFDEMGTYHSFKQAIRSPFFWQKAIPQQPLTFNGVKKNVANKHFLQTLNTN